MWLVPPNLSILFAPNVFYRDAMSSWIPEIDIHDPLERYCTIKNNEVLEYDVNINEKSSPFEDLYYATLNSIKYLFLL